MILFFCTLLRFAIIISLLSYSLISYRLEAQTKDFDNSKLEYVLETIIQDEGDNNIISIIEALILNPVELRTASITDIVSIPTIDYNLAHEIKTLASGGLSIRQIADSLNLNESSAYLLEICSFIQSPLAEETTKRNFVSRTRLIENLNKYKGFEQNKFVGSRTKAYQRLLASYDNINIGALGSKDLGEDLIHSFLSGFISYSKNSFNISLGDFYVLTGLGNISWSVNSMGKGADVISPATQFDNRVINSKSSTEYGFFRGISLSNIFNLNSNNSIGVLAWASSTPMTATIDTSKLIATSIYTTGQFRTEKERNKHHNFNEKNLGGNIYLKSNNIIIGYSAYYLDYMYPIQSSSSAVINGKNSLFNSFYFNIFLNNYSIASEVSRDGLGNMAYKLTGELKTTDYTLVAHGRSFASKFRSPYGYMFGEQSNAANEYGLYLGFDYKKFSDFTISTYVDYFGSWDRTYYIPEPMKGIEILNQTKYLINSSDELLFRLFYENKTDITNLDNKEKVIFQRNKYNCRFEYLFYPFDKLRLRTRFDLNLINFENVIQNELGFASFIEGQWQVYDNLRIATRFAYFSTDSYESAIWHFESIFPGYFNIPALFRTGYRTNLTVNYTILKCITLRLRYMAMKIFDVSKIGSGNMEIDGNTDQHLYFQIDIQF